VVYATNSLSPIPLDTAAAGHDMNYKAQPIHEGGAVAHSLAAMCRNYNIDPEYVKLEVGFAEGRCLYHLHGRASALFSFDEKAATYEEAETKACRALEQWRTYGVDNDATPQAAPAPTVQVPPITQEQKKEIIRLLNHPMVARQEKTKMLLNLNRLDTDRAAQAIEKLLKAIDERENIRQAA
jgi:hypothetical protein